MIGWIAGLILKRRPAMAEPYARMVAKIIVGMIAFILFVLFALNWIQAEREEAVDAYKVELVNKATKARETAATERLADVVGDAKTEGELRNAINQARPGHVPMHPATRALSCERLRHAHNGRTPPACRTPYTGGAQAPAK